MKSWYRLRAVQVCGRCNESMKVGDVAFEYSWPGGRRIRCHRCASQQGESMPDHIAEAPTVAHEIRTDFSQRIASIRGLAKDWKHAQGGDRDDY